MKKAAIPVLFLLFLFACGKEEPVLVPEEALLEVPPGFPEPVFPEGNELTAGRWVLGKKLFYDKVMSVDSSTACVSCHLAAHAFSDTVALSPGAAGRPGVRNAPSLANIAYHPYFTREGGVPTLEMQILVPIQEHNEFDFNILLIAERLNADSQYVAMSRAAYGRDPDAFVITRSIACFERTLISGSSRYDKWVNGTAELNDLEMNGMNLFFSDRTMCYRCHAGFNFTSYAFENNGLYTEYTDPGRFRLTELESDRALFKIPSLRNVGLTAPYMHDGSMPSLKAVVDHYNNGGRAHPHKSQLVRPLDLTALEKAQLVAFLGTLTDLDFVKNEKFKNE